MKSIGILGGMGPQATAELYMRIIRIFQDMYGAKYDDDFPEIFIYNLPLPDVVDNLQKEDLVKEMLVEGVKKLEKIGADFIAIPCNTVTKYLKEMEGSVSIPIINIVEETRKKIASFEKAGLLATKLTIRSNLYPRMIVPAEKVQNRITGIIMNILAGKLLDEDKKYLEREIGNLLEKGAERVVLGCTELPLLVKTKDTIDTIQVLAEAIVSAIFLNTKTIMEDNGNQMISRPSSNNSEDN